jgi:hypothetical protein
MERSDSRESKYKGVRPWFEAAEALGEFIGIRYGQLAPGATEPSWHFYAHADFDGIGAFADLLRRRGADIKHLPQIKYYPAYSALGAALKHWPPYLLPRRSIAWRHLERDGSTSTATEPPESVAWHVFDEEVTQRIRLESRKNGYTVNSLLLKALTDAIRPSLARPESPVPWMVPVNMRGGVNQYRDTDNHTSYVAIRVRAGQSAFDMHHRILKALSRGEHWGNWHAFKLARCLTRSIRVELVRRGLCLSQWSLGAFSNLGEWDPDHRISDARAIGDWLFSPPTLRSQMVAAGCVTFQGRLSLTLQTHPELTTSQSTVRSWMDHWVCGVHEAITPGTPDSPSLFSSGRSQEPRAEAAADHRVREHSLELLSSDRR